MGKKLTHEMFITKVMERNEKVRNGDIEIVGEYVSASDRIQCVCHIHDVVWSPFAASLYKGIGCKQCRSDAVGNAKRKTYKQFQEELAQLRQHGRDIYSDDIYISDCTKIYFHCSKQHKWQARPNDIFNGDGCPYCSGRRVMVGENSLWDTRPDIAVLLQDPQNGYKYSAGSDARVDFVCPTCSSVNQKIIGNVCRHGLVCKFCSDKISYPQKFARALLKQLPVINVEYEYDPDWLKPYRFDAYFEYAGCCYALEMDGHIGHGNRQFGTNEKDIDGYMRDVVKDLLAVQHNIQVIRIDCNYQMYERFEYVKRNVLNSKLNDLFNLNGVDWIECDRQGQEKLVPKVAALYNDGLSLLEIQHIIGYSKRTIGRWLKQAKNIGLCDYNTKEARRRGMRISSSCNVQVNQYTMDGEYINTYISMSEAERKIGTSNLHRACDNPNLSAGGYRWFKASNPDQPDKSRILLTIQN